LAKIRINKLALELNVQNDQIIDALHKREVPVKNYMSSIDEETAELIRNQFRPEAKPGKAKTLIKLKSKTAKKTTGTGAPPAKKVITQKIAAQLAKETEVKRAAQAKIDAKEAAIKKAAEKKAKIEAAKNPKPTPVKVVGTKKADDSKTVKPKKVIAAVGTKEHKQIKKPGLKIVKKQEKPKEVPKKAKPVPVPVKKVAQKRPDKKSKRKKRAPVPVVPEEVVPEAIEEKFETVQLEESTHIRDLAEKLKCSPNDIIMELMSFGTMATINQSLDFDSASKVADKRGYEVEAATIRSELSFEEEEVDLAENRITRPPIVTIMGHVDHGKTSLLDAIRETNLTQTEHGGITQHIGAYQAKIKGNYITFLDTPGHEAFTAMRARGAQVTDIVILVVAADDGIKPQTKEALHHANAAGVPIIVAINKIDKPDAKPEEVKKQLADQGLLPEDWGGQTIFTEVSALKGTGIDQLLEMILLQAEIMDLKSNPSLRAKGVVIESKLDKGRGPVATLVVQSGTLKVGQPFIVGALFGKVRALLNDKGNKILTAPPSTPVEILGLPDVPQPGEQFIIVKDEKKARQLSSLRLQQQRESILAKSSRITMDDLHQQIMEGKIRELNLIVKADVQGSIMAVQEAFSKLDNDEVRIKTIHDAVGGITESDVLLATASNAIIIGFNVRPTDKAQQLATRDSVDIRMYSIIYDAINDMKKAMDGLLEPKFIEKIIGRAEVREVFTLPKIGTVAGVQVVSGKMERNMEARLIRDSVVVYQGKIGSLRRFKDDVKEVASGYECGLCMEKYQDLKQGDIVEPFILEEIPI
jgi:translation initiation factor IF-2